MTLTRRGMEEMVLLAVVTESAKQRRESDDLYARAVRQAHLAGITNTAIAQAAGISETAIRMYLKRHP